MFTMLFLACMSLPHDEPTINVTPTEVKLLYFQQRATDEAWAYKRRGAFFNDANNFILVAAKNKQDKTVVFSWYEKSDVDVKSIPDYGKAMAMVNLIRNELKRKGFTYATHEDQEGSAKRVSIQVTFDFLDK